mmetsp:Transcript_26738/g.37693  ORF Transcript_26738/g.37693 Transcript_26738/m.37693 type:complete len:238 (-) Transcript_26738:1133-1846(-)
MKFTSKFLVFLAVSTGTQAFVPQNQAFVSSTALAAKQSVEDGIVGGIGRVAAAAALSFAILANPSPALADGQTKDFKLPPIDFSDKTRCTLSSSAIGQANAARDKLYDLRQCSLSGKDASGFDLSGVIMTKTDVSKTKFVESYFSKGYLHDSNFDGADFTNAIVDRASFKGSSLRGTIFTNAVLTGTSFENADVENADFSEAYIGDFDIRALCKNPTLKGENPVTGIETRISAGCKN